MIIGVTTVIGSDWNHTLCQLISLRNTVVSASV